MAVALFNNVVQMISYLLCDPSTKYCVWWTMKVMMVDGEIIMYTCTPLMS